MVCPAEQRDIHTGVEALAALREAAIYIPYKEETTFDMLYPQTLARFDDGLFEHNLKIIRLCTAIADFWGESGHRKRYADHLFPLNIIRYDQGRRMITEAAKAPAVFGELSGMLGFPGDLPPVSFLEAVSLISAQLKQQKGKKIIISPNHTTDAALTTALKEMGQPLEKVGLLIIDKHLDLHPPVHRQGIGRANFLHSILAQNIGGVALIGLSDHDIRDCEDGFAAELAAFDRSLPEGLNFWERLDKVPPAMQPLIQNHMLHLFYQRYRERLHLVSGIVDANYYLRKKHMAESIQATLDWFRRRGVENIILSVDIDSLDMFHEGITGCEYNPLAIVLSAGVQDLRPIIEAHKENLQYLTKSDASNPIDLLSKAVKQYQDRQGEHQRLAKKPYRSPKEEEKFQFLQLSQKALQAILAKIHLDCLDCLLRLKSPYAPDDPANSYVNSQNYGGFRLAEMLGLIHKIKVLAFGFGINMGVQSGEVSVVGSITEASGPDVAGRTVQAVYAIADALYF